jgi:diaminopimelate epimerase
MGSMRFVKMHGCGNDYVYVDGRQERVVDPAALARRVSDRHFGIGGDGLILVLPSEKADARMRMFNADGSEAEMCGNGVRCVAKYAHEAWLDGAGETVRVEVGREPGTRVLPIRVHARGGRVQAATVDMGAPVILAADAEIALEPGGIAVRAVLVSMGNPHCVTFGEEPDERTVATIGPRIERHPAFPDRTNVELAHVVSPSEIRLRVWERGSGETLACGTGACATVVAAALTGRAARRATVRLLGGDLDIEWHEADGHVHMTGPCVEVFRGELSAFE